jgi:hypothetical protein
MSLGWYGSTRFCLRAHASATICGYPPRADDLCSLYLASNRHIPVRYRMHVGVGPSQQVIRLSARCSMRRLVTPCPKRRS